MFRATLTVLALVVGASGCTILVGVPPGEACTSDDQCASTSQFAGFPSSCRKYFCNEGTCQEYGEGDEVCDGWDNDCDGLIDEPSADGTVPWRSGRVLVEGVSAGATVSYGAFESRAVAIWTEGGVARRAPLIADGTSLPEPVSYATTTSPTTLNDDECFVTSGGPGTCSFGALVSAPTSEHEILASVTTAGCTQGRLLVGHTPPNTGDENPMVLRGPDTLANSAYGVDVIGGEACTGVSRAGCSGSGDGCGAARPVLGSPIDQGVGTIAPQTRAAHTPLAWIGDAVDRPRCGGTEVPVEAMVIHFLRKQEGVPYFWVAGSGDGRPETLGTTTGGGGPALARFESRGWLVGYGAAAGGVDLHWIAAQGEPPDTETTPVPPVDGRVALGSVGSGDADHIALSAGATRPSGTEFGMVWLEGCGTSSQRLFFQRVSLVFDGPLPSSASLVGDPVTLATTAAGSAVASPVIRYVRDGLVVPGFERAGTTADAGSDGGWSVAWVEGDDRDGDGSVDGNGRVMGALVAELDGQLAGTPALLSAAGSDADAPGLYGDRFVYRDRGDGNLVGGSVTCAP